MGSSVSGVPVAMKNPFAPHGNVYDHGDQDVAPIVAN